MDSGYKAVLTAVTVGLVLTVAQAIGRRQAGLLAALPVTTAPALLWLTVEQGAAVAARSATGILVACGVLAVYALVYEVTARRAGPGPSLLAGMAAAVGLAAPASLLADRPIAALLAAATSAAIALVLLPRPPMRPSAARQLRGQIGWTAVAAGTVSVGATALAGAFDPFWAGVLAALPIISAAGLLVLHQTGTLDDVRHFLRGYVLGLLGKAGFALVFAILVQSQGAGPALVLSVLAGFVLMTAVTRLLRWTQRQSPG
jgi:hypothetical protein